MKIKTLLAFAASSLALCFAAQSFADDAASSDSGTKHGQHEKAWKGKEKQELLARVNEALSIREKECKEATAKGHADIASALEKLIGDLKKVKAAIEAGDKEAFKAADEQRKADREALESLRKSDKGACKKKSSGSSSGSSSSGSSGI